MAQRGRKKKIPTPEDFWGHFLDYKIDVEMNPFEEHDFVGKDASSVRREKRRCLTMEGFELYLYEHYDVRTVQQYLENRDERYSDFVSIVARVRKEIRRDQIEGGMAGIYNQNLTARLQGLTDKQDHNVRNNVKLLNIDPL